MYNWQYFLTLIPIAVIISIIVFLVRFFGKVITDQVPFADSRSWHEEFSGITFFANYVLSPVILVSLLYSRSWNIWYFQWADFWLMLIGLISTAGLNLVVNKSINFFKNDNFEEGKLDSYFKNCKTGELKNGDWMIVFKYAIFPVISIFIIVMLGLFYKWQVYYQLASAVIYLFLHLTGFALFLSLKNRNILFANIKFINKNEREIKNCRILKVNDDNIRVKDKNVVKIINKSLVSKVEIINKSKPLK